MKLDQLLLVALLSVRAFKNYCNFKTTYSFYLTSNNFKQPMKTKFQNASAIYTHYYNFFLIAEYFHAAKTNFCDANEWVITTTNHALIHQINCGWCVYKTARDGTSE